MKKWQITISILLVFAIGTAVGTYGSRVLFKKRVNEALRTENPPGIKSIRGMMDRLELSESQRASINDISDANNKKWETLHQEYVTEIQALYKTVIDEAKKELTDPQREEIENMSAEVQRRLSRRDLSNPRSSTPKESSGRSSKTQLVDKKSDPDRVAGIIEQLQIETGKSAEAQSIIEKDLQNIQALRQEFEESQAAAKKKAQEEIANIQADTEKKLKAILTPDQMETYRLMIDSEQSRHENFGDNFEFDTHGEPIDARRNSKEAGALSPLLSPTD